MYTPKKIIEDNIKKREETLDYENEQLFVKALKIILGLQIWFYVHDLFISKWLKYKKVFDHSFRTEKEASSKVHEAIDLYNFFWLCVLLISYIVFIFIYRKWDSVPFPVLLLFILLSAYRILDIFAGLASLHLRIDYKSPNPIRAIVLTIINYFQIVLSFSVLYLCFGFLVKDYFNEQATGEFYSGFMNAIYFSLVTITTLGYGDFSPQTWLCKLTTIAEVSCGIVIIVVALQRVISLTQNGRQMQN